MDRGALAQKNAALRRDFDPVSLVGNYGHGAAARIAQPKVPELPWAREGGRVVLYLDHENSAFAEAVE
jgi:hypothetical protein